MNDALTNPPETNFLVVTFFALGALMTAFLVWRFTVETAAVFRRFGYGLALTSAALVVWAIIVWLQPENLHIWASLGIALFMPAFVFFLAAATDSWEDKNRKIVLSIASIALIVLFVLRTFIAPSEPGFSERGLFYFNAQPIALIFYVFAFAGSLLPAIYTVTRNITDRSTARITLVSFNIIVLCCTILLVSYDDDLQALNAVVMGAGFLALILTYLRKKPS